MGFVSIYSAPITNITPCASITLEKVHTMITTNYQLRRITAQYRANGCRKEEKRNFFPFATFGGTFSARKNGGLLHASGYVTIDIDDLHEVTAEQVIEMLTGASVRPILAFVSPSGAGVKAIYNTADNGTQYGRKWEYIATKIEAETGVIADPSGKDIARACFLCYDPNAFFYPDAPAVEVEPASTPAVTVTPPPIAPDYEKGDPLGALVQKVIERGVDIAPSYDEWRRLCAAIKSAYNGGGYAQFSALSDLHTPPPTEAAKLAIWRATSTACGVGANSIFYLADFYGVRLVEPQRQQYQRRKRYPSPAQLAREWEAMQRATPPVEEPQQAQERAPSYDFEMLKNLPF